LVKIKSLSLLYNKINKVMTKEFCSYEQALALKLNKMTQKTKTHYI
jgi:hypothetical protein